MSYSKYETYSVGKITFADYDIYRTEDCKIQLDSELTLDTLTQGNWKEGDHILVEVDDDSLVTFTKVNVV
jgi:hypothetical protein